MADYLVTYGEDGQMRNDIKDWSHKMDAHIIELRGLSNLTLEQAAQLQAYADRISEIVMGNLTERKDVDKATL